MNESDLIEYEGKRYKRISSDEAFRIRKDIQLYWKRNRDEVSQDSCDPDWYRLTVDPQHTSNIPDSHWWRNYSYCILVDDPDKQEYRSDG